MFLLLTLGALLTLAGPNDPEEFRWPAMTDMPALEPRQDRELVDVERSRQSTTVLSVDAALHGRFSLPFGFAERNVISYGGGFYVIESDLSWSELFDPGWGATLTIDISKRMTRSGSMGPAGFEVGGYISFQQTNYGGNTVDDQFGNRLQSGDLNTNAWMIGVKMSQPLQGQFYADGRFGLGAVHYAEVEGTFDPTFGPAFRDVLFKDTWTFAMELLGHAGVRFGPLGVTIGLGFNMWMPPSDGNNLTLDSGPMWNFFLELGVELGF